MGIDGKDVCFIIWKILKISKDITFRYVRRYPVVSGVSAFLVILYTFLPWVFYFLLCSSPLIGYVWFYPRNHDLSSKIGDLSEEGERADRGLSSVSQEGRTEKAELKHQRSVRRNARRKVEEVGKDWDSSQASEDERGKVILTTLYGEVLPETITPDLEKFKRERTLLVGEEISFDSVLDNSGDVVVVDPLTSVGDETEVECSSSSSSEEEEEEERCEDRNKVDVVAWTEDDQKNLMDLGTSEIERNKRLENLISRRRSRRFFLLAAEGSLMDDMEVPRICIGRNFYGFDKENYEIDGLLMPGSAPSVLLPRRNPFDLPYDPLEEKPNLTGDSFQQEFAEANPKDIFFCRHESFHHRVHPSTLQKESKLASSWRNEVDGGRLRQLQGSNDQPPLLKEREKGNDMEAGEVRIETGSIRNDDSDSNASLSPREREKDFNVSDQSDASGTFCKQNARVGNSLAGLVPRSSGSSSLATARQRYMEHFGYNTRKCHMVTHSVDSDLQVEVSELGSPPTSVDGNDSDYERSMFVYESDMGKEMSFNGGEYEVLPVGKDDQDLNETASPEIEEAEKMESMVPRHNEVSSKRAEELKELPENSAEEIKISYDSDEPQPSHRTDQESEEPRERNDGEEIQHVTAEAEASSDVNHHGNSEESATSPRSVLPDMLHLDQTNSEDLVHTSVGQLQNVDPPAESSHNQIDEKFEPTEENTIETVCSDAMGTIQEKQEGSEVTYNDEPIYAEDHRQSIDPLAVELKNNQTDGIK